MYYFIVNPSSRSGKGLAVWRRLQSILNRRQAVYRAYFTRYPGHGTQLAKMLAPRLPGNRLCVIGGDGTLNEVLSGIIHPEPITLGYIPVGSGNDFARGLGLPTDPVQALSSFLNPRVIRTIDLGILDTPAGSYPFGISSGSGYDAQICSQVSRSSLKKVLNRLRLGNLIYAIVALKLLFTYRPSAVEISTDGQPAKHFDRVYFTAIMNLPYEGGGFRFCPAARPDDGLLDCIVVHHLHPLKILLLFPSAYLGLHTRFSGVTILRGRKIRVRSRLPVPLHRDGEYGGISRTTQYRIRRHAVNMIIR